MSSSDPKCLTTATINRLLRPLRTRCNVLTKLATATPSVPPSNTYSSSNRVSLVETNQNDYPLVVLPPPEKLASRVHFAHGYKDSLELSRRIYAVRDAFRNIAAKADLYNTTSKHPTSSSTGRHCVPSLAALCATVIGRNIQGWEQSPDPHEDEGIDVFAEEVDYVDEMYEAMPSPYRGWLLVAHGLGIILDTCPHHPTLISILLDVALTHRLESEASQLLQSLAFIALRPKPNARSSLCHPAHSRFLVDYLDRWMAAGLSIEAYTTILTSVLDVVQDTDTWRSRAIECLGRRLCYLDIESYVCLATQLAIYLSLSINKRRRASQSKVNTSDQTCELYKLLCQWTNSIIQHCVISRSTAECQSAHCGSDGLFEFIRVTRYHSTTSCLDSDELLDFRDSLTSLASHWLSLSDGIGANATVAPPTQVEAVVKLLSQTSPRPSTFSGLIKAIFSSNSPSASSSLSNLHHTFRIPQSHKVLKLYIACFQKHHLPHLEASFWAGALHFAENLETMSTTEGRAGLKSYREKLMDLVEESESRLFENPRQIVGKKLVLNETSQNVSSAYEAISFVTAPCSSSVSTTHSKDNWKWDLAIGCWVRQRRPPSPESGQPVPSAGEMILRSAAKRPRIGFSPKKGTDGVLEKNRQRTSSIGGHNPSAHPPASKSHKNNFMSLVANAASRRTVLHPAAGNRRPSPVLISSDSESDSDSDGVGRLRSRNDWVARGPSGSEAHQTSDDILDLFADRAPL